MGGSFMNLQAMPAPIAKAALGLAAARAFRSSNICRRPDCTPALRSAPNSRYGCGERRNARSWASLARASSTCVSSVDRFSGHERPPLGGVVPDEVPGDLPPFRTAYSFRQTAPAASESLARFRQVVAYLAGR